MQRLIVSVLVVVAVVTGAVSVPSTRAVSVAYACGDGGAE